MKRTCQDFEKYGHIVALLPEYKDGMGECVVVLYDDGHRDVHRCAMRSALDRCARAFGCTVPLVRDRERRLYGRSRQELPLPFEPYFVLVPFRWRTPRVPGDSTLAYVNFIHIESFEPMMDGTGNVCIRLKDGSSLPTRHTDDKASRRFEDGYHSRDHLIAAFCACGLPAIA